MTTRQLDLRGRACPIPIVELMRTIKQMPAGDEVELLADDPAFRADVTAWCHKTNNELVRIEAKGKATLAVVRKGG